MQVLLQSFQEHSLIWILISAGVGGLIGALIKFLFEQILSTRYQHEFKSRAALKMYKYPILRSADSLDRRLQNYVQFVEKRWYDDPKDNYYRISTLYILGAYFGWCKILEDEAFLEFETSNARAKKFNIMFNTVYKGLTGFQYFDKINDLPLSEVEAASVPRLAITAISELMIKKPSEKEKDMRPTVLGFIEFVNCFDKSPDFQKWFGYLDKLFVDVHPSDESAKWNRVLAFATNVRAFVSFLDPSTRLAAPRMIYHLKRMHPQVREYISEELKHHGFAHLISKDDR
jgi:hypothetical protein